MGVRNAGAERAMRLLPVACVAAMFLAACNDGMSPATDDTPARVGFPGLGRPDLCEWGDDRGRRGERQRRAFWAVRSN